MQRACVHVCKINICSLRWFAAIWALTYARHGSCFSLEWRDDESDGVSNHQPNDCLPNRLFRRRSKKTSKLRVSGLFVPNSPVTGEFPAQRASSVENVSIWWRHHVVGQYPWRVRKRAWELALELLQSLGYEVFPYIGNETFLDERLHRVCVCVNI